MILPLVSSTSIIVIHNLLVYHDTVYDAFDQFEVIF